MPQIKKITDLTAPELDLFPDIPSPSFSISMNQNRGSSSQKAQM